MGVDVKVGEREKGRKGEKGERVQQDTRKDGRREVKLGWGGAMSSNEGGRRHKRDAHSQSNRLKDAQYGDLHSSTPTLEIMFAQIASILNRRSKRTRREDINCEPQAGI